MIETEQYVGEASAFWKALASVLVFLAALGIVGNLDYREEQRQTDAAQSAIDQAREDGYRAGFETGLQEGGRAAARTRCRLPLD